MNDTQQNAENFNSFFASVGPSTNASVGRATKEPRFFYEKAQQRNVNSLLTADFSSEDVVEACKWISKKKSKDAFGLSQATVLSDMDILAPHLAHLATKSVETGTCPDASKIARVIPIYKKGNHFEYENYRPISLLPTFSKIVEKLIYNKITQFLIRYSILFKGTEKQF